jgi:outer membrane autotransporter protein
MANKPKFLKNLLTTASAFSVLAIGATEAMGVDFVTGGVAAANTTNGANIRSAAGAAPQVPGNGDTIYIGVAQPLILGGAGSPITVDLYGFDTTLSFAAGATPFTLRNTTDGSAAAPTNTANGGVAVVLGGQAAAARASISLTAGANYTANQATTDLVKSIDLNTNTLTITGSDGVNFTAKFTSTNGGAGIVTVDSKNVTFSDVQGAKGVAGFDATGGTQVQTLNINDAKSATLNTDLTLFQDLVLGSTNNGNAANAVTFTVNNGKDVTVRDITSTANNRDTLTFVGGSKVDATGGNIGANANALATINIGTGVVEMNANVTAIFAQAINFTGAGGELKLQGVNATITGNILNTSGADQTGTLSVNGNKAILNGSIGANAAKGNIAAVKFYTDHELQLVDTNVVIYAADISQGAAGAANGKIGIQADTATIASNLGGADRKLSLVNLYSNKAAGAGGIFTLADGKGIYATELNLAAAAFNNKLVLGQGTTVDANVTATGNAANGIIQVNGDSHITGAIGTGATPIAGINFNAAKVLTVDGAGVYLDGTNNAANALVFGANDGTLALTATGVTTLLITKAANGISMTNGNGAISSAVTGGNTFTINSPAIGTIVANAGTALKLISVTGGGNLALTGGDVNVQTIDMGGSTGSITLNKNGGNYQIGTFANAANATLATNGGVAVTLVAGTQVGTAAAPIKEVRFANAGDSLSLADGVNIYATNGITTANGNAGNLALIGDHIISGVVGAANQRINNITITAGAAGKITTFLNDVNANGNITFGDANSAVKFTGNVNVTNVVGFAPNAGTVEFVNPTGTPVKYTGTIGAVTPVGLVKISGGDVEITGAVTSNTGFAFDANSKGTLTLDTGDLANNNVTVGGNKVNSIVVKNAQNITGNIGTAANQLATIKLDNGAAQLFTVRSANFFSGISFAQNNLHNVALNAANVSVSSIGDNANAANSVTFLANGAVGDTYSKTVVVNDGITATFNGALNSSNGTTLGSTANGLAIANFADGAVINTTVDTLQAAAAAGKLGTVNFAGGAAINQALGATQGLAAINFNGQNKVVQLGANIKATTITLNQNTLSLTGNATVDGKIVAANSSFALANNTLTVQNGATSVTGASTISTIFDGSDYGKIVVSGAGNKLDFTGANVTVNIHDSAAGVTASRGKTITIGSGISNGSFILPDAAVSKTVSELGPYVVWNYVPGSNGQFTSAVDLPNAFVNSLGLSVADANILGDERNTGDAAAFADRIAALDLAGDKVGGRKAVDQMNTIESSVDQLIQSVLAVNSTVAARVADVTAPNLVGQVDLAENTGVAAGDNNAASYGVWGTPFYSQATQSNKAKTPGYKSTSYGVTVGFDTRANDTMTVGAAVSVVNDTVKYKGSVASDKSKSNTYMFSVYGMQQLTDNWFLQGTASFGSSSVKNTAARLTKTATGKYDSMTYGGQLLAGYHVPFADTVMLTPMGGLKYNKFNDTGYKETGADFNRTVSKKSVDKLEGVIGARATFFTEMNGVTIIPGMHGFVNYDFLGKKPNVTARIDGLNANSLNTNIAKPERAMYNVGLSVKATYNMMEYGAGYDAYFTKKYAAHQGSLKVRVNF